MYSRWGIGALCVAFTAGISLSLVVVDSSGGDEAAQTVEAGASLPPLQPDTEASSPTGFAQGLDRVAGDADGPADDNGDPLVVNALVGDRGVDERGSIGPAPGQIGPAQADRADNGPAEADRTDNGTDGAEAIVEPTPAPVAGATAAGGVPQADSSTAAAPRPSTTAAPITTPRSTAAPSTAAASTAAPSTAAPSTTAAPTTAAPTTPAPQPTPSGRGSEAQFESIRNKDPKFTRYADVPESGISIDALTESSRPDNGSVGDGQFRMYCDYSHFSYDDPIVHPGQPGKSHLHMFFGNTATNAHSTADSLLNSGGGSCQGFELNRSGYWTPAVLDGRGNVVVPDQIVLYYKTKQPGNVQAPPQGLQMLAGDPTKESFQVSQQMGWSCGGSGTSNNQSNRIPNCGGDRVNFYIQFPNCWDGQNLSSADKRSHVRWVSEDSGCPGSHPVRLPQITILAYFPSGADSSGWYLSSDRGNGFNTGPGATLHADWFGAWNDEALNLWMNGCMKAARNCSEGQTGTPRRFAPLSGGNVYQGDNYLPLPG